jgi:hypothetical protein
MIQSMDNTARDAAPAQLNSLTLSPRGVLVARVPAHTELGVMEDIRNYLKECFPNNRVVVLWDSVDLSIIEDESYNERMCLEHDTTNYY